MPANHSITNVLSPNYSKEYILRIELLTIKEEVHIFFHSITQINPFLSSVKDTFAQILAIVLKFSWGDSPPQFSDDMVKLTK